MRNTKSLFESKTFWGIILTIVSGLAMPIATAIDSQKLSATDLANMVLIVTGVIAGGGGAIVGRVSADSKVYTPNWMPGPNKEDGTT